MEDNVGSGNHSDSDTSSESWTFVEPTIPNAESQDSAINSSDDNSQESVPVENVLTEQVQEEVDTDGVAVITDDEEVSSTVTETCPPWYPPLPQRGSLDSLYSASIGARPRDPDTVSTTTFRDSEEELPEDFYLADEKIKSYVHRRNNKVSNVLNIVLLGTVVTAVTLAVGFMWGINDTCSLDMLNSVNKILSNLQKLQHENDILKSKIKMLQFMQHNRPIKDPYFQHQMLETNIFDNPQNMDIHFHSTNGPVGSSPHKPVYHYMDGKDAYLELNESEDETYLDSENVSKQATEGEKISKIINGNESPSMGPRTYNQYREDKFKYKNDCRSSGKIHSSSKIKSSGKVDSSGKMDSSGKKDSSGKRDSSGKNKEPNSEKYDKKKDKKLKRENSDWYHKMYNARKVFRERGFDDYTFGGRNKANWYFRRMNDREKHREGEGPSIKKRQKEYFKSKQ